MLALIYLIQLSLGSGLTSGLTGKARVNPVSYFPIGKSDVETNGLNRPGRFAIDTQSEKGILAPRVLVRDSPYILYMTRNLRRSFKG